MLVTITTKAHHFDRTALELDGPRLAHCIRLAANPKFVEGAANHQADIATNIADIVALGATFDEAETFVEGWMDESDPLLPARWAARRNEELSLSLLRWDGWGDFQSN